MLKQVQHVVMLLGPRFCRDDKKDNVVVDE